MEGSVYTIALRLNMPSKRTSLDLRGPPVLGPEVVRRSPALRYLGRSCKFATDATCARGERKYRPESRRRSWTQ